jgi:hypothetical protein
MSSVAPEAIVTAEAAAFSTPRAVADPALIMPAEMIVPPL